MQSVTSNAVYNAQNNIPRLIQVTYQSFTDLENAIIGFNGLRSDCVNIANVVDNHSPMPAQGYYWWNVITFGVGSRMTQIACQAYIGMGYDNALYMRSYHDFQWNSWNVK